MADGPDVRSRGPVAVWHSKPGTILCSYVLLLLAGGALEYPAGLAPRNPGAAAVAVWLVVAWLIWRVWRHGRISRQILTLGSGYGCVNAAVHIPGHPAALVLIAIYAGQLALMLSPALSLHSSAQAAGSGL